MKRLLLLVILGALLAAPTGAAEPATMDSTSTTDDASTSDASVNFGPDPPGAGCRPACDST